MKISLKELRGIAEVLLDETHKWAESDQINVELDYYWSITPSKKYDMRTNISAEEITVGQTSVDFANLRELLDDSESYIPYTLIWLGEVLQALGSELSGIKQPSLRDSTD